MTQQIDPSVGLPSKDGRFHVPPSVVESCLSSCRRPPLSRLAVRKDTTSAIRKDTTSANRGLRDPAEHRGHVTVDPKVNRDITHTGDERDPTDPGDISGPKHTTDSGNISGPRDTRGPASTDNRELRDSVDLAENRGLATRDIRATHNTYTADRTTQRHSPEHAGDPTNRLSMNSKDNHRNSPADSTEVHSYPDTDSITARKRKLSSSVWSSDDRVMTDLQMVNPAYRGRSAPSPVVMETDSRSKSNPDNKVQYDINGNTYYPADHCDLMDSGLDVDRMDLESNRSLLSQLDSGVGSMTAESSMHESKPSPAPSAFYLKEGRGDDTGGSKLLVVPENEPRVQSLPSAAAQSSYTGVSQSRLPPKKRRLYYEQDLGADPTPPVSHRETSDQPQQSSLPADFTPPATFHLPPPQPHVSESPVPAWMWPPPFLSLQLLPHLQQMYPSVTPSIVHDLSNRIGATNIDGPCDGSYSSNPNGTSSHQHPVQNIPGRPFHPLGLGPPAPDLIFQQVHLPGNWSLPASHIHQSPEMLSNRPLIPVPPSQPQHILSNTSPSPSPPGRSTHILCNSPLPPEQTYQQHAHLIQGPHIHAPINQPVAPSPPARSPYVPCNRPPPPNPPPQHILMGHGRDTQAGPVDLRTPRQSIPEDHASPPADPVTSRPRVTSGDHVTPSGNAHTDTEKNPKHHLEKSPTPPPKNSCVETSNNNDNDKTAPRDVTSPSDVHPDVQTDGVDNSPSHSPGPDLERVATEADEDGDLPLHIAVVQNELRAVQVLVDVMCSNRVSVDYQNHLKQTALHLAVITRAEPIVRCLLKAGASPSVPDRKGQTCFHLAATHITTHCLLALLGARTSTADINLKNYEGQTPLHRAVQTGNTKCIETLLEHGADINLVDGKSGKTPLYLAFECNQPLVADLLLARGADVNIPTYSGSTVLQAANTRGQHLLSHIINRSGGEGGSSRDFQIKLAAKVNRNRNKQMAVLQQKNMLNTQDGRLNNQGLMSGCPAHKTPVVHISKDDDTNNPTLPQTRVCKPPSTQT